MVQQDHRQRPRPPRSAPVKVQMVEGRMDPKIQHLLLNDFLFLMCLKTYLCHFPIVKTPSVHPEYMIRYQWTFLTFQAFNDGSRWDIEDIEPLASES